MLAVVAGGAMTLVIKKRREEEKLNTLSANTFKSLWR